MATIPNFPSQDELSNQDSRVSRWLIYAINLFFILSLGVWLLFAITSLFACDKPGACNFIVIILFYGSIISYPLLVIFSIFYSFRLYEEGRDQESIQWSFLPLIVVPVIFIALTVITSGNADDRLPLIPPKRPFVCRDGKSLIRKDIADNVSDLEIQLRDSLSNQSGVIGKIYGSVSIYVPAKSSFNPSFINGFSDFDAAVEYISSCKAEGNTFLIFYPLDDDFVYYAKEIDGLQGISKILNIYYSINSRFPYEEHRKFWFWKRRGGLYDFLLKTDLPPAIKADAEHLLPAAYEYKYYSIPTNYILVAGLGYYNASSPYFPEYFLGAKEYLKNTIEGSVQVGNAVVDCNLPFICIKSP